MAEIIYERGKDLRLYEAQWHLNQTVKNVFGKPSQVIENWQWPLGSWIVANEVLMVENRIWSPVFCSTVCCLLALSTTATCLLKRISPPPSSCQNIDAKSQVCLMLTRLVSFRVIWIPAASHTDVKEGESIAVWWGEGESLFDVEGWERYGKRDASTARGNSKPSRGTVNHRD